MSSGFYHLSKWVARALLTPICWPTSRGGHKVPKTGPVLLVSNHGSFLDPPLIGVMCHRRVRFVARSTLADSRILGWWMRGVGTYFVDRNAPTARAMQAVVQLLDAGEAVSVFPEGTRTRNGDLGAFKRGILLLLKKSRATVVPTGVRGSFHALPPGRRLPRFRHCSVVFGDPMTAEEVLAEGGLDRLRRRVGQLSGQRLEEDGGGDPPTSDSRGSSTPSGSAADPRARAAEG